MSPAEREALLGRIVALRAQGLTHAAIGEAVGLTKSQVTGLLHRGGLCRSADRRPAGRKAPEPGASRTRAPLRERPVDGVGTSERAASGRRRRELGQTRPLEAFAGSGVRFRRCQYIAGRPSADDTCKCGRPTDSRGVYCAAHQARCVLRVDLSQRSRP